MNGVIKTGLGVLDKKLQILDDARSIAPTITELQDTTGINEGSYRIIDIEGYSSFYSYTVKSKVGGNVSIDGSKIIMDYSNIDIDQGQTLHEVLTLGIIQPGKFLTTKDYEFDIFYVPVTHDEAISNPDFMQNEDYNDGFEY